MATTLREPKPVRAPHWGAERVHRWEARRSRRNVGGIERGARLFAGAVCLGVAPYVPTDWAQIALAVAGGVALLTGTIGYCPLSRALGRDSYHAIEREPPLI